MMKKIMLVVAAALILSGGTASAQMGGGRMGSGAGAGSMMGGGAGSGAMMGGSIGGTHVGGGYAGSGAGYGMHGAGTFGSIMMGGMLSRGYVDILKPIASPAEARGAIQAFLDAANTDLQITELWEFATVYKAELSDASGQKAFDLLADKFTGAVSPEMGFSLMMNSSYASGTYRMAGPGGTLTVTAAQATAAAQDFIDKNSLGYVLAAAPETYPGYYKFHTTVAGGFGLDIMVNGYNGRVWLNTILGAPLASY